MGRISTSSSKGNVFYREPSGMAAWETFSKGYGPAKTLAAGLDEGRRAEFKRDFIAFHDSFPTDSVSACFASTGSRSGPATS